MIEEKSKDTKKKSFLIIRFSSIGDIVLTTPIVRALRLTYPEAKISFLVKENFKVVIADNPLIDEILLYKNHEQTVALLMHRKWDQVIDLQTNLRSRRLKIALNWRKNYSSFPKLNILKWLQVQLKLKVLPKNKSIIQRYFYALRDLNIPFMPELGLEFYVSKKWELKAEDIPLGHQAGYVLAVIGGSKFTKRYPIHHWQALVKKINLPIIIIGGSEDMEAAIKIKEAAPDQVYNAIGKFNLQESALLTQKAKVVIANDTGFMHIAAAYQRPLISLWGNTIPEFGMYPYYGSASKVSSIILETKGLSCRPCSKIGYDACPKKHFKCMELIHPDRVVEACRQLW